ncbi:4-phosphoerythronate dehydrogenase [Paraferrimonas haliotis]|nr:4-phosphoerythronate dehydrogenase [Paraferrimonas haliotis]
MQIVADENMPYVDELFGQHANIRRLPGRTIQSNDLVDVDILLVRSVTKVNAELLHHANRLKFVGSATIGLDHIDEALLRTRGINYSNAPGCNATGVGQYVATALLKIASQENVYLKNKRVGIIGAGNTGSATFQCLSALGMHCYFYDPLLEAKGDKRINASFEWMLENCDVLSFHVPLTHAGPFPTHHMVNERVLSAMKPDVWLVNACRGGVIDNKALLEWRKSHPNSRLVLDVWEGEPQVHKNLVEWVDVATPHIAGYSMEGKARGTWMLYQWLAPLMNWPEAIDYKALIQLPNPPSQTIESRLTEEQLNALASLVYDLNLDDELFRKEGLTAEGFDGLRKNHQLRREFSALTLVLDRQFDVNWLKQFGFTIG